MMKHTDNPAGRLFLVFQKAKEVDPNKKSKEAWAEIFDVASDNTAEILRLLGKINELPSLVRKQVLSIKGEDHDLYLESLTNVENALTKINFGSSWKVFLKKIDETTIKSLEFCSALLSKSTNEKGLSNDQLKKLNNQVKLFKEELSEANIDGELKKFIFARLSEIERAIFDYKISGIKPIEAEIERSYGSIYIYHKQYDDTSGLRKFYDFLGDISVTIHLFEVGYLLSEEIPKLLN